ncbi:MAG: hypothetical protein KKA07_08500 [Bacteroidetes bacterium]|nr:hypothetical protein [Bacteroidota bacterium]MBU1719101.1 hypothetical protein [Bacteroidota bacterium]
MDDTIYLYLNIPKEDKLKIYEFSSEYRIKAKIRAYLPLYVAKHRNITLIKQQELDEIFLNWDEVGIMRNEKNCCWNEIRDKLGHIGFINMSRPFFFDDGRKAIITFGYSWGGLSGAIYNFMFIKQNGSWKIFYAQVLSVS